MKIPELYSKLNVFLKGIVLFAELYYIWSDNTENTLTNTRTLFSFMLVAVNLYYLRSSITSSARANHYQLTGHINTTKRFCKLVICL